MKTHLDRRGSAGVPSREKTGQDRSPTSAKEVGEGIGEKRRQQRWARRRPKSCWNRRMVSTPVHYKRATYCRYKPQKSTSRPFLHCSCHVPSIRDRESCDLSPVSSISVPLSLSEHTKGDPSSEQGIKRATVQSQVIGTRHRG
jgi:hypothetical protein